MEIITIEERLALANADLLKINAAIDAIINNTWVERLEIGSQEFRRVYDKGNKPSLTELYKLRKEILELIDSLSPVTQIVYRQGASVPLVIGRRF